MSSDCEVFIANLEHVASYSKYLATGFAVEFNRTFARPLGGVEQDRSPVFCGPNGFVEAPIEEIHALAVWQYFFVCTAALCVEHDEIA